MYKSSIFKIASRGSTQWKDNTSTILDKIKQEGFDAIPLEWYWWDVPTIRVEAAAVKDPETVVGLYVENAEGLQDIDKYPNLIKLEYCSSNRRKVPAAIAKAKQLRYLQITCEQITALPYEIAQLKQLKILDLGRVDKLKDITALVGSSIKAIAMSCYTKGANISDWTPLEQTSIEYLELSDIELHYLGKTWGNLPQLKELKGEIRFQKEIDALTALHPLEQLEIKQITSYKEENKITNFNRLFANQTALKTLVLGVDEYFEDYSGLSHLIALEQLRVNIPCYDNPQKCDWIDTPKEIAKLQKLEELHVVACRATD